MQGGSQDGFGGEFRSTRPKCFFPFFVHGIGGQGHNGQVVAVALSCYGTFPLSFSNGLHGLISIHDRHGKIHQYQPKQGGSIVVGVHIAGFGQDIQGLLSMVGSDVLEMKKGKHFTNQFAVDGIVIHHQNDIGTLFKVELV